MTVGFGFTPNLLTPCGRALAGSLHQFTAGGEFHSALRIAF